MIAARNLLKKQATEDYLKTIYLLEQEKSPISTTRIVEYLQIKPPSITHMIQKLADKAFVIYRKHFGVTLTKTGKIIALEMRRLHRRLELFLTQKIGFGWDEVHDEAYLLEHVISEKFEDRIAPFDGPITIEINQQQMRLGNKVGEIIIVKKSISTEI